MNSHSVLVVDSDPAVHDQLTALLGREDRTVDSVFDGGEALQRLRHTCWEIVIAGQGKNGLGGVKLLRKIRALQPEAKVILIGDPDPATVLSAVRNRGYAYFHKPVPSNAVNEIVQQAIESKSWQDDLRVISARPEWITLEIRCKLDAAERTAHYLREILCDLAPAVREDVCAAIRELLMNAIEHGGKSDPSKRVRLSLIRTARSLIGHIHDPGTGFSLEFLPHAAISNPEDSPTRHVEVRAEAGKRPGGFGILMTRNLVDELLYNEKGNSVLFVKYLS